MATSSITKSYYTDIKTFMKLKKDVESNEKRTKTIESPSLKNGREKLATFVFR